MCTFSCVHVCSDMRVCVLWCVVCVEGAYVCENGGRTHNHTRPHTRPHTSSSSLPPSLPHNTRTHHSRRDIHTTQHLHLCTHHIHYAHPHIPPHEPARKSQHTPTQQKKDNTLGHEHTDKFDQTIITKHTQHYKSNSRWTNMFKHSPRWANLNNPKVPHMWT